MRRTIFPPASVATAAALVPSTLLAIAGFAFVALVLATFAVETFTRPAILVTFPTLLAHFRRRCAVRHNKRGSFAGRCGLRPAEILVTIATPMPVTLAFGAIAGFARLSFAGRGRLRAFGGTIGATISPAVVARRAALIGAAAGAPDLDQFGLRRRCGCFG
jgi:hypothetical protein